MKARFFIAFIFLLMVSFLFGCSSPKKLAANGKEMTDTQIRKAEQTAGDISRLLDSARKTGLNMTFEKVEYYPPGIPPEVPGTTPDSLQLSPTRAKPHPKERNKPPDVGPVKSIARYKLTAKEETNIKEQEEEKTETSTTEETAVNTETDTNTIEEPAADPLRWRYIFGILLLAVVLFFIARKSKLAEFIKGLFK